MLFVISNCWFMTVMFIVLKVLHFMTKKKKIRKGSIFCITSSVTSRGQHLPTASGAGCSSAQRGLVFELGLHDGVMFVFQVEQDGSELLILTQISKRQQISASISFH